MWSYSRQLWHLECCSGLKPPPLNMVVSTMFSPRQINEDKDPFFVFLPIQPAKEYPTKTLGLSRLLMRAAHVRFFHESMFVEHWLLCAFALSCCTVYATGTMKIDFVACLIRGSELFSKKG